jgi:hypothetical protein
LRKRGVGAFREAKEVQPDIYIEEIDGTLPKHSRVNNSSACPLALPSPANV